MHRYACNVCNSQNIQRLALVYQDGTTTSQSLGFGGAFGSVGGSSARGVGVGGSVGFAQTELAARFAPPPLTKYQHVRPTGLGFFMASVQTASFLLATWVSSLVINHIDNPFLGFAIWVGCVSATLVFVNRRLSKLDNRDALQHAHNERQREDLARWERSALCLTCGAVSEVF